MTTKIVPLDPDPDFSNLPRILDGERGGWGEEQKWQRHLQEVEENAKQFDHRRPELVREGMSEIEAAVEAAKLPVPWMNKRSLSDLSEMREKNRKGRR
jgi:hypothetical protein